jgi:hypothetical protein
MRGVALLALALATLAACGGGGDAGETTTSAPGGGAVSLEGETLDGRQLSVADLRGKPVFVNVWASW